jgi:hypothetical protein
MKSEPRLTVESCDGSSVDEYRITGREVEFRPRRRRNSIPIYPRWRRVTEQDISLHLALQTAVGEWLRFRLPQNVLRQMQQPQHDGALPIAA